MRRADYVYRNKDDDRRVRIFKRDNGTWDMDEFRRWPKGGWSMTTWTSDATDPFPTLKEARATAEDRIGQLTSLQTETVTEGWPERPKPKATKDAAIKIERGQLWRFGSRQLVVDQVSNHWNQVLFPGEQQIGCHFITPSGRERGSMIVGRKSARQSYREQHFREKFRFVPEEPELNRAGEAAWLTGCSECGSSNGCDCNEES